MVDNMILFFLSLCGTAREYVLTTWGEWLHCIICTLIAAVSSSPCFDFHSFGVSVTNHGAIIVSSLHFLFQVLSSMYRVAVIFRSSQLVLRKWDVDYILILERERDVTMWATKLGSCCFRNAIFLACTFISVMKCTGHRQSPLYLCLCVIQLPRASYRVACFFLIFYQYSG